MEVGTWPFSNIHLNKIFKMSFNNSIELHQAKYDFKNNFKMILKLNNSIEFLSRQRRMAIAAIAPLGCLA